MKLLSPRLRLFLIVMVWLTALLAALLWFSGSKVSRLTIGGGPAGSESLELTIAIAEVLNASGEGFEISVFETGGSYENLRLLDAGRIDMGEIQGDANAPDSVQSVLRLYQDAYHLIAREDMEVASVADLRSRRVAIPPDTSGQYRSFWNVASHFGLGAQDLFALPMNEAAADFAMEHGQVAAVFRVRSPGNLGIRSMISNEPVELVAIRQSEAMALKQPAIEPGVIPMGAYRGAPIEPASDLATVVVQRLLVARSSLDPAVVFRFTQAVYEHRAKILGHSALAGFISPLPGGDDGVIPNHPGARSYYDREKPGFMQQNARVVSALLYTAAILFSAVLGLRTYWVRSRRMRMHQFNQRLMEISTHARSESEFSALLVSKQKLIDILAEVVQDLESERVSQEEFEHFSFTWQAVDALVRDRMALLLAMGKDELARELA